VERLLTQGYIIQFLKKDPPQKGEGGEARQHRPILSEVLIILRGSSTSVGVTSNKRTRLGDQVLVIMGQESSWHEPITFIPADGQGVKHPYDDTFMISTVMEGHRVHKILMDNGNSLNILLAKVMTTIGIDTSMMTIVPTPLIGMEGSPVPVKGAVGLTITMGTAPHCETLQQTLMVIATYLPYNAIIERPLLYQINVVVSTKYL